jgi:ribokinase
MSKPRILVIGSINMDIVMETKRFPLIGETILGDNVSFIPGGKGANQAVAAARLGGQTSIIGAVGDGTFGDQLLNSLSKNNVDISAVKRIRNGKTGMASICVANEDNTIIVIPGANHQLTPDDISEEKIKEHDIVLLQLEIPIATVLYTARKAKSFGKTVILNPAPATTLPEELFQYIDFITPNTTELAHITKQNPDREKIDQAMKHMQKMGPKQVITTLGKKGAAYFAENGSLLFQQSFQVPVVDTTGAGDCFNGALAVAVARGDSMKDAVEFASIAAALAVTKLGAQSGMPTEKEVHQFKNRLA